MATYSLDESKLKKLEEEMQKHIKTLPLEEKIKVAAIHKLLTDKKKLDEELENEIRKVNQKYESMTLPLFEKQNQIVLGTHLPNLNEISHAQDFFSQDEISQFNLQKPTGPITQYWYKVLKNLEAIQQDILKKDEPILQKLVSIVYKKEQNVSDFSLTFVFEENEFFTNQELTKKFFFKESEDQPFKSEGTEIQWKEGKNVTKKTISKKQKNKKSGQTRTVKKEVDDESFFNFFKSQTVSESKDKEDEEQEDEEANQQQERMDIDYDIASNIIDEGIPYSLEYYLGIREEEGEEGDEHDDHDEGDDDDADLDDEDEEDAKKKKKKNKKKPHKKSDNSDGNKQAGAGAAAATGDKEQCKQQ